MFIDTHCHLDFPAFDPDRDDLIKHAKSSGLDNLINVGADLKSSQASVELALRYDLVYAAVGVHPHDADTFDEDVYSAVAELAANNKVVAIGEIGLDYYKNYSKPANQRLMFADFLNLSRQMMLPVIIHSRDASRDTLKIIKDTLPLRGVVHCFSQDQEFLQEILSLGFFVSFTANITYKNTGALRDIIRTVPLERIFLETDAPYLSPEGLRGRRNEPAYIKYVAEQIAQIKAVSLEEVARVTSQNARQFFKLSC